MFLLLVTLSHHYLLPHSLQSVLSPWQTVDVLGEDEDGWWRGKVGDRVGLFPSNFVDITNKEGAPSDPAPSHEAPDGPRPHPLPEKREFFLNTA